MARRPSDSHPAAHSAVIAELVSRVQQLEARIESLESTGGGAVEAPDALESAAPPAARTRVDLETALGLTWFNRVGAVVLVIGLVLAALWANDRGYLTPVLRNLLGALAAAGMFAIGVRATSSQAVGRRRFGLGITLVGACGLYLVSFTASRVDVVLSSAVATVLMVGVTAMLGVLSVQFRRIELALIGLAGGLVVPLMVGGGADSFALLFIYLALLTASFVGIQVAMGWRWLDVLAPAGVGAYYFGWIATEPGTWAAFAVGVWMWGTHLVYAHRRGDDAAAPEHRHALLWTAAAAGCGILAATPELAWLRVCAGGALLAYHVWVLGVRGRFEALLALLGLGTVGVCWLAVADAPFAASFDVVGLGATLVPLPFAALYVWRARTRRVGLEDQVLACAACAAFVLMWLVGAAQAAMLDAAAPALISCAAGWLAVSVWLSAAAPAPDAGGWARIFGAIMATIGANVALTAITMPAQAASVTASLLAVACGLVLVAAGVRTGHGASRIVGLAALAGALAKMVALDVWMLAPGPRIGAFIAIGSGLLGASFFYSRYADRLRPRAA